MPDYIFLMHDDATSSTGGGPWKSYIERLRISGHLRGGSAIGSGVCVKKGSPELTVTGHLSGFIRVVADNLDQARTLVVGNPVFESGGMVEIRELPESD